MALNLQSQLIVMLGSAQSTKWGGTKGRKLTCKARAMNTGANPPWGAYQGGLLRYEMWAEAAGLLEPGVLPSTLLQLPCQLEVDT